MFCCSWHFLCMWLLLFKVISSLLLLIFMFRVVNYTLSLLVHLLLYIKSIFDSKYIVSI